MDAIAREAHVSKGGLYRHFASKDELFLTIAARTATELEGVLRQASESNTRNGYAALEACIRRMVTFAREKEGKVKLALDCSAVRELVDPEDSALPAFDLAIGRLVELALDVMSQGQKDGSIRCDVHVQALAVSVWGAVVGALQVERNVGSIASRLMLPFDKSDLDLVTVIASSARPFGNGTGAGAQQSIEAERAG